MHCEVGPLITSFALIVPAFFSELVALRNSGVDLSTLVGSADCTFNITWNKYVFGVLYFVLYRQIRGRWRKTAWPACIVAHPREDRRIYEIALDKMGAELERRTLPPLQQLGLDHFPGLKATFLSSKAAAPSGRVSLGLGHMLKNLRLNQTCSRRRGTPALVGGRSIRAVVAYVHISSTLPTRTMFHLLWSITGPRISHVWNSARWWLYFKNRYLRTRAVDAVCGVPRIIGAS